MKGTMAGCSSLWRGRPFTLRTESWVLLLLALQIGGCQSCEDGLGESFCMPEPSHAIRYCPVGCRPGECSRSAVSHPLEAAALSRTFAGAHQFAGALCLSTCSNPSEYECQEESGTIKGFSYCSKLGGCTAQTDCSTAKSFYKPSCAACAAVYPLGCWPLLHASGDHGLPPPTWHIAKAPLYDHPDLDNAKPDPEGWPEIAKGMSKAEVSYRWKQYRTVGDGICGVSCEAEKAQMCQMQPKLCMQLRCQDLQASPEGGGNRLESTCTILAGLKDPVRLSLAEEQMVLWWRLLHSTLGNACYAACRVAKKNMCSLYPRLCVALRCEDAATGRGNTKSLVPACAEASAGTPEEVLAALLSEASADEEPQAVQVAKARWRLAWALSGACGAECIEERQETCRHFPLTCAELMCEDAWNLHTPVDILPACGPFYPPPQPPARPLTEEEVAVQWAQLLDAAPEACDSECRAAKEALCAHQPELCLRLLCGETSMAGHWQPELEQTCDWAGLDRDLEVLLPSSAVIQQQVEAKWAQLVSGQQPCGAACEAYKRRICLGSARICVVLSCSDAEVYGASPEVLQLCQDLLQTPAPTQPAISAAGSLGPFPLSVADVAQLSGLQITEMWSAQFWSPTGLCGLECMAFKFQVCRDRGFFCIELTCSTAEVASELSELCKSAAEVPGAQGSPAVGGGQALRTAVSAAIEKQFADLWGGLSGEGGLCDVSCEVQKAKLCAIDRPVCVELRCRDILAGLGPFGGNPGLSIICQKIVDADVQGDSLLQTKEEQKQRLLEAVWVEGFLSGEEALGSVDLEALLLTYEGLFARAWGAANHPSGTCSQECYKAKVELCRQDVVMCIYMRCQDVSAGIDPYSNNVKVQDACLAVGSS